MLAHTHLIRISVSLSVLSVVKKTSNKSGRCAPRIGPARATSASKTSRSWECLFHSSRDPCNTPQAERSH